MGTLLVGGIVLLILTLVSLVWLIPAVMKRNHKKFLLFKELTEKIGERISKTGEALAEFNSEAEDALKILKLETDTRFVEGVKKSVQDIAERELNNLERVLKIDIKKEKLDYLRSCVCIYSGKGVAHIINNWTIEVKKRAAAYQKNLEDVKVWINVAWQHLGTYTEELAVYEREDYQLGPDRHFTASEALIKEAEKIMATDAPDPEKAIAKCKEASELAAGFVGRINVWLIAHEEAKELLEQARKLEHHLRERYAPACEELDLLQREYPVEVWYPLDLLFGGNQIPNKLEELAQKRFGAMDKMDMKVQDFEGAVVELRDLLEELKKLEEVVEKPFKTRAEQKSIEGWNVLVSY